MKKRLMLFAVCLALIAAGPLGELRGPGWSIVIVAQPKRCGLCVTGQAGQATLFRAAYNDSVIGLLAHDYLAGALFKTLQVGDRLEISADGRVQAYQVMAVEVYRPVQGSGLLIGPEGRVYDPASVYERMYTQAGRLVLQTCHAGGYWFVVGEP